MTGMQGDDDTYLKVSACLKHYSAYSQETGRQSFPAMVQAQDMEDTYLPVCPSTPEGARASPCLHPRVFQFRSTRASVPPALKVLKHGR